MSYLDPRLAFDVHQGLQPVKAQLRSCSSFLSEAIPGLVGSKPYTAESYRVVLRAYAIALNALDDTLAKLAGVEPCITTVEESITPLPPDIQDEGIEAKANDLNSLQGLTEFAVLRVDQLVNPMELHKLPTGKPGEPEFERNLKARSELYCSVSRLIDALQHVLQYLVSPLHSLPLEEEDRGKKFREAKKEFLVSQIKHLDDQLEEVKEFVTQVKETRAKLEDELATVDQTILPLAGLFTFSGEGVPGLPSDSEPPASI